jgi:hypothetical protein
MRVVCWECPDCGHQAHVVWKDTPISCTDCAAEMEHNGLVGCVTPVADANTANE